MTGRAAFEPAGVGTIERGRADGNRGTGFLVVLAGVDGSGKTSQARRLHEGLLARGWESVLTRAPGDSPLGREIRRILLRDKVPMGPSATAMLFMADRAEHVERVIAPALARGAVVVCDRYAESTMAYQAPLMAGDGAGLIEAIHDGMGWPRADLTLHMRIDPTVALARIVARGEGDVDPDGERLGALATTYDRILGAWDGPVARVDAGGAFEDVAREAMAATLAAMRKREGERGTGRIAREP